MAKGYLPVRLSHLMRHSSVGSVVRYAAGKGRYIYMVIHDIREWTDKYGKPGGEEILFMEAIKAGLGIDQKLWRLPVPVIKKSGSRGERIEGVCIPASPFPKWARCLNKNCKDQNLLVYKPWVMDGGEISAACDSCGNSLYQVSWVMVTADGSLADLDYHFIAHREAKSQEQKNCGKNKREKYLELSEKSSDGIVQIKCSRSKCNCRGHFDERSELPYNKYTPSQPWLGEPDQEMNEGVRAEVMKVNDIRLHSSITSSALVIPPESKIDRESTVAKLYRHPEYREELSRKGSSFQVKSRRLKIAERLSCKPEELLEAQQQLEVGWPYFGSPPKGGELLENEYEVLCGEEEKEGDFRTEKHTKSWVSRREQESLADETRKLMLSIHEVVALHRIKEVMIFRGFERRVGNDDERTLILPDIDGSSNRLPALELYGEGIFFALNENVLQQWECNPVVQERAAMMRRRFVASKRMVNPEPEVTPRFILLHTLSHLMIRQLESEAGYPAASLKERIYASENRDAPMAGILIYVATPDVAGTLGGLAELAEPERFAKLLQGSFEHGQWCSLDPVCGEHDGQGPDRLNLASCHGCSLVPEPSCAYGNILLDRVFLRGNVGGSSEEEMPGLLSLVEDNQESVVE